MVTRENNMQNALKMLRFLEQKKLKELSELFSEKGKWIHPYHSGIFPPETTGPKEIYKNIQTSATNFTEIHFPVDEVLPFLDRARK